MLKKCHCEEAIFGELVEALLKESASHAMKNASGKYYINASVKRNIKRTNGGGGTL